MKSIFYGWKITWALAITQTVSYGVLYYGFGVFTKVIEQEFAWSRAETSGAFSLALLISGLLGFVVGSHVDKNGARFLMTMGSIIATAMVFAWSLVVDLKSFYLVQAGIGVAMSAVLYPVAFTVIAVWFRSKRPKAMLVVTFVAGLASTIFIPLETYLLEIMSWREALRVLALIIGLTTIPLHAFIIKRRPADIGLEPDGIKPQTKDLQIMPEIQISRKEAFRSQSFWWYSLSFALSALTINAIATHLVPLLLERGLTSSTVAAAAGSVGLMQLAGRIVFTPLNGRLPLKTISAITFATHTVALIILYTLFSGISVWLFVLFYGIGNGAITLARAALIANSYGAKNFGSISGSMAIFIALTQAIAPIGAGFLHDLAQSYNPVLITLIITSLVASIAVYVAQNQAKNIKRDS